MNKMPISPRDRIDAANKHDAHHHGYFINLFNKTTVFLDSHIQEMRYVTYGIAAVGLVLTARSIRMLKQFQHAREIPEHFFTKNVRLQGVVRHVRVDGTLSVEHIPIITLRWMKYFQKDKKLDLPIQVSGVSLTNDGLSWLRSRMVDQHIWFRLVRQEEEIVQCIVSRRKNLLRTVCLNKELVQQGLARVQLVKKWPDTPTIQKFNSKLKKVEIYAERKGLGLWERPPVVERARAKVKEYQTSVTDKLKQQVDSLWKKVLFWRKPS